MTYADHVVVVTPVSDNLNEPNSIERERGEGILLPTTVLEVSQVLWSRKDAAQPAPSQVTWLTPGVAFKGGIENQKPMTLAGEPRIERGHTYIAAIAYSEAFCSEGDPPQPAEWFPLGSSAILPYDSNVIGLGEYEGKSVTPQEMADLPEPEISLRGQMVGLSAEALVNKLNATQPEEYKEVFRNRTVGSECQ